MTINIEKRVKGVPGSTCSRPNCTQPVGQPKWGLCKLHYERAYHAGLLPVAKRKPLTDLHAPCSYDAALQRVRARRGNAKAYPCARCGGPSRHWTYVPGTTQHEQTQSDFRRGRPYEFVYSGDPADWLPACRPCVVEIRKEVQR